MSRPLAPRRGRAQRGASIRRAGRRASGGFTLVELTVSLVAGLVVALAVAGLSREATASFNEEIRVSAAEAALRGATDRLRADLTRASFMSTGNIQGEPSYRIGGLALGAPNVPNAAPTGLKQLQGIHLMTDSTGALTTANGLALDLLAQNGLKPSTIDITGNMTSVDQFSVESYSAPPTLAGLPATCCQINLAVQSDSVFRMLNSTPSGVDPNADAEMRALFQPVSKGNSTNQFLVRLIEPNAQHSAQYLLTCPGVSQVAGIAQLSTPTPVPYVVTQTCPVQGAVGAVGTHCTNCLVNPVQTVRWEIVGPSSTGTVVPLQDVNALDNQSLTAARDPAKYDLVRSFLDSATAQVIPETTEVIAEYAIDMDFAFTVDTTTDSLGKVTRMVSYDFGDTNNQLVADYAKPAVSGPATPDPQRIRSVRFRLATRAAQADRTATIPTTGGPGGGAGTFLYRYCINPAGCSGNALMQWARVRTAVSEVALPNQEQLFF